MPGEHREKEPLHVEEKRHWQSLSKNRGGEIVIHRLPFCFESINSGGLKKEKDL